MAEGEGATITLKVDDSEVKELCSRLIELMGGDLTPVTKTISEIIFESVQRNFEEERSPEGVTWKPLSAYTLARRRHPEHILRDTMTMFRSIHPEGLPDRAIVGTNINYAATHQFGRGRIPARPFLGIRETDWPEIKEALIKWISRAEA